MVISFYGLGFVKIAFGDTVVAVNPISKDSKIKGARFGADIALISLNDRDTNGADAVSRADKNPFVINGPGEYEIGGVFIKGYPAKSSYGGEERINTVYLMTLENMNLCFLGALGDVAGISGKAAEELQEIDILFVPVSGEGTLSPLDASKLAVKLEPSLIVPTFFDGAKDPNLASFLKAAGEEKAEQMDKLTLKKKDLEGKEGDVVVLLPQTN